MDPGKGSGKARGGVVDLETRRGNRAPSRDQTSDFFVAEAPPPTSFRREGAPAATREPKMGGGRYRPTPQSQARGPPDPAAAPSAGRKLPTPTGSSQSGKGLLALPPHLPPPLSPLPYSRLLARPQRYLDHRLRGSGVGAGSRPRPAFGWPAPPHPSGSDVGRGCRRSRRGGASPAAFLFPFLFVSLGEEVVQAPLLSLGHGGGNAFVSRSGSNRLLWPTGRTRRPRAGRLGCSNALAG